MAGQKVGVVLFQLGGPDSMEAVEPFLYNLFSDPDIINFPGAVLARKPLARVIASRRSKKTAGHYREIGGKSPIVDLTMAQARALQAELDRHLASSVHVAMRYWHPLTEEAIAAMKGERLGKIILLPLYPHYSKATTGSSLREWDRQCARLRYNSLPTETIRSYHNHPLYIEALADAINRAYGRFSGFNPRDIDLIFSAHGVPRSLIRAGDPYQQQIEQTVALVVQSGGWQSPNRLCYQSRVGPGEWLKPSLLDLMRELASEGRRHFLVIPISFVTEHIETLHEIDMEARLEAVRLGVAQFEMMPALNDNPKFIGCLADLVLKNERQ
ncbi:MAG: ferrochelatase [Ignavibacteria bacterium]|nr:MAG: ferrochelatase [Ignavibacteria bacterium]